MSDQSHPCVVANCDAIVEFDDEPFCFTHSPDSGSAVPGYSYKKSVPISMFVVDDTLYVTNPNRPEETPEEFFNKIEEIRREFD